MRVQPGIGIRLHGRADAKVRETPEFLDIFLGQRLTDGFT